MSFSPGWSVSDLISAVNWTIEFIIALKSVRAEVKDLKTSLERAESELVGLEDVLEQRHDRIEGPIQFRTAALTALQTDLYGILNDIFSFLKKFDPQGASRFSTFGQSLRWVIDSRYSGTMKAHYQASTGPQRQFVSLSSAPVTQEAPVPLSAIDKESRSSSSPSVASVKSANHRVISRPPLLALTAQSQPLVLQPINAPPSPPPSPPILAHPRRSQSVSTASAISAANQPLSVQISRASTLPPSTSSQLISEILQTVGDIKVWFLYQDPKDTENVIPISHPIKTITIIRDGLNNFRGIHSTRFDNAILEHKLPSDKFFLKFFSHPCPTHSRQVRDLKEGRMQVRNCVSFLLEQKDVTTMIPDYYSFSSTEDYRTFQTKIVGERLLFWVEVRSISSKWSPTPLCENQVLQVWETSGGDKKIQFWRNGKDKQYSKHYVSALQDMKKSLKQAQKEGLKLIFKRSNGSAPLTYEETRMEYLLIIFSNPKEIALFLEEVRFD